MITNNVYAIVSITSCNKDGYTWGLSSYLLTGLIHNHVSAQ